jgi:hypothetical protein
MDLLEEIDRRLAWLLERPWLPQPLLRADLEALRELIHPTLVREGRRPSKRAPQ